MNIPVITKETMLKYFETNPTNNITTGDLNRFVMEQPVFWSFMEEISKNLERTYGKSISTDRAIMEISTLLIMFYNFLRTQD